MNILSTWLFFHDFLKKVHKSIKKHFQILISEQLANNSRRWSVRKTNNMLNDIWIAGD